MHCQLFCSSYLLGAASLERDLDLGGLLAVAADLAGRVPVQLRVHDAVELLPELQVDGHEARGAVEGSVRSVQLDL